MDVQPGQIVIDMGGIPLGRVDEFGVDWAIDADGLEGWGATGSTRETVQNVRSQGGWSGEGFPTARVMAVRGRAYAPTPEDARAALDRIGHEASIDDFEFTVHEPGLSRTVVAHRTRDVQHVWQMPTVIAWAVNLTADDSRKLHAAVSGSTRLPSVTGGLTVPFTVPYSIAATQVSGQVSLTNPGNTTGPVKLRIDGPCSGPVVTHVNSGKSLVFASSLVLGAGEWLDIDMDARTVYANGQANRRMYVTSAGWSGFEPGDNTWSFTAAAYNAASLLTVTANPADK